MAEITNRINFATWVDDILTKNNIKTPPVNVFNIANNEGIELGYLTRKKVQSGGVEGKLYFHDRGKNWIIKYNKEASVNRQRFTVAHELAHYFIHGANFEDGEDVLFRSLQSDPYELQANQFAAELLMPKTMIIHIGPKIVKKSRSKPDFLKQMSETFMTSMEAMKYRLNNLGVIVI
jgi:Zn-dependent peptidase ImmA (M78 family)